MVNIVREVIRESSWERFLKNLEYVSDMEMDEIETSFGSPEEKVFYSEEIEVWLDKWAKLKRRSRSRFIEEEMTIRLKTLEDKEITRLYDELYSDPEIAAQNRELAEEMLDISTNTESPEEKW
jgi:lysine/ornithine N-monooxygenase